MLPIAARAARGRLRHLSDFGLSSTGLTIPRLADIKADLEAAWRTIAGANVNLAPQSVNGQIIGIVSERLSLVWEQLERVYFASYLGSAEGVALENLVALGDIRLRQATHSVVPVVFHGTPGTVVPAETVVRTADAVANRFVLAADATIGAGGTVAASMAAESTGPVAALTGQLTYIATPVSGLTSVTNPVDATVGRDRETGAALRLRFSRSFRTSLGSSVAAVFGAVSRVLDVQEVQVHENVSDGPDLAGRPPHSIEVVVRGGADTDVAQAIWDSKAAGIRTYGTAYAIIADVMGDEQMVYFSRAVDVPVWIAIDYWVLGDFPSDGEDQIRDAILEFGSEFINGRDVLPFQIVQRIEVPGIEDLVLRVGRLNPPGLARVTIGSTEIARFDSTQLIFQRMN